MVTENPADLLRLAKQRAAAGEWIPTLVITSNRSFRRRARGFIGPAVRALTSLCGDHPGDDGKQEPSTGSAVIVHPNLTRSRICIRAIC